MALTLAQIDALLDAAYAAINVGELSFTGPGGRQTVFHSLDTFQRWIDWLEGKRQKLQDEADAASGAAGGAILTRFVEGPP